MCSTTVTTIYYLVSKVKGTVEAIKQVKNLLRLFDITYVGKKELESALHSKINDYEDAVLHESAMHENLVGIVTRNTKDFKHAGLPVYTPEEMLDIFNSSSSISP